MDRYRQHRFAVAPMMDWTDRHCRVFHRALSSRALLYTEMVTAPAVLHGDRERLLGFSPVEHPVALQLGGSDPDELARAARIGTDWGYDEINLNVGCPSDRVQSGRFGACLMQEPALVADCVAAMRAVVHVPVTVKCRLGVDDQDPETALDTLADAVVAAGAGALWVHARKAWLKGLSPKENRDIPPLDYDRVVRLKARLPHVFVGINGGIATLDDAEALLARGLDGVMLGRAAYHDPALLADVDSRLYTAHPATADDPAAATAAGPTAKPMADRTGAGGMLPATADTAPSAGPTARPMADRTGAGGMLPATADTVPPARPTARPPTDPALLAAVETMRAHIADHLARGGKLGHVTRHMLGLFQSRPGARAYRRILTEGATRPGAGLEVLDEAMAAVMRERVREVA